MSKSTAKKRRRKPGPDWPEKPYPDFPLGPVANGRWQKRINGKLHYFGRWGRIWKGKMERVEGDGWEDALELHQAQRDELYAGRPPMTSEGCVPRWRSVGDRSDCRMRCPGFGS